MLLAVDVGNTQTVLRACSRASGSPTASRLADRAAAAPATSSASRSLRSSSWRTPTGSASRRRCRRCSASASASPSAGRTRRCCPSGRASSTGIPIRYDDPREVGPDRIVNAVAAWERYGPPCIVVDFGTSTNFDIVSPEGEYVGGVLAPGIEVSMEALFARAARLVKVDFVAPPTVIGKTTVDRAPVRARLRLRRPGGRHRRTHPRQSSASRRRVATGGLADLIAPHAQTLDRIDPPSRSRGCGSSGSGTPGAQPPP